MGWIHKGMRKQLCVQVFKKSLDTFVSLIHNTALLSKHTVHSIAAIKRLSQFVVEYRLAF